MPPLPARTLLIMRGEARRAARRSAQMLSRNYTLDRIITPDTSMANPSDFQAMTSVASETSLQNVRPSASTYILDRPPTLPSIEHAYQLPVESLSRFQHVHHPQEPFRYEAASEVLTAPREPWLMIAGVGCLSFYGLMWIGEVEAAGNQAELEKAILAGEVIVAANGNSKAATKIKAEEWFRPF